MKSKLICVDRCIYRVAGTKIFLHKVKLPGKKHPTKRKLNAKTLIAARIEVETINTRRREAQLGVGLDPYSNEATIGPMAKEWQELKCPDKKGRERTGEQLASEVARLKRLLPFWEHRDVRRIIPMEDCQDYRNWRKKQNKRFRLDRSVDAELTTLSNLLNWAAQNPRKTGLNANPLANRPSFDDAKLIRHCTKVMPRSDEHFHQLAKALLSKKSKKTKNPNKISAALGWQLLLEGMTGCRTSEILACRMDANQPNQPGYHDDHALHVHRCKDGIEPWALFEATKGHEPFRECFSAFLNWRRENYPNSPWFIPGHKPRTAMRRTSLTRALHRLSEGLGLPLVVSHGLRAYFVRVMRSLGVDDDEIAKRLGHRDREQVQNTYGTVEPGWFGKKQMDFLPEGMNPAWSDWLAQDDQKIISIQNLPKTYHL